ncbi:MAG: ABC transporter ATP-binding protein [Paludibacteraceae bacterium]|nr:ABC transporter ATP-binding protein [Paludibacteraceae bacterium]
MIRLTGIHKSFGQLEVLKGIDLHIKEGEFVSIVGASGAGKTTLLQIIGTLDTDNEGEVVINGVNIKKLSDKELSAFRNKQLGFVFQFHQLLPEFTALENVCMPGLIARRNHKEVEEKAKELLTKLGLQDRFHHKPNELSGGEKQRVAVARALINNPKLILADEPSGSLDSGNKKELHSLLRKLCNDYGLTILLVTHDNELAETSDRIITMRDGMIV